MKFGNPLLLGFLVAWSSSFFVVFFDDNSSYDPAGICSDLYNKHYGRHKETSFSTWVPWASQNSDLDGARDYSTWAPEETAFVGELETKKEKDFAFGALKTKAARIRCLLRNSKNYSLVFV